MSINATFVEGEFTIACDGGNRATLDLAEGDISIQYNAQDGRVVSTYETRGHLTGIRKTAREYPTFSGSAKLAAPNSDFDQLVKGATAGYVSTVADITCSDDPVRAVDFTFSFDCGSEIRQIYGEDLVFEQITVTEGDPSTISYNGRIVGPLYQKDADGITTIVSAR